MTNHAPQPGVDVLVPARDGDGDRALATAAGSAVRKTRGADLGVGHGD